MACRSVPERDGKNQVSVIARNTRGGGGLDQLNGYTDGLSVKCYETNFASLMTKCLTRPVM